jgi:5-formyltetrahydrofolate cyclo-ligase
LTFLFLEREVIQSIARNPVMEGKSALRANLLASRDAQGSPADQATRNEALGRHLAEAMSRYPTVSCVGFYWPLTGEFDARDVLTIWLACKASRTAGLPVVVGTREPLAFHAWEPKAEMKTGRYRIPVPAVERVVTPELLVIPCLGFDAERYRLGYGGGYYDRTLAFWEDRRKPVTIGVAFESGLCGALPREPHDIPLDVVVTEASIY